MNSLLPSYAMTVLTLATSVACSSHDQALGNLSESGKGGSGNGAGKGGTASSSATETPSEAGAGMSSGHDDAATDGGDGVGGGDTGSVASAGGGKGGGGSDGDGKGSSSGGSGSGGGSNGGGGGSGSVTSVWKSSGCGKAYTGAMGNVAVSVDTWGKKDELCADHFLDGSPRCGLWGQAGSSWRTTPISRSFYVNLPAGYDEAKPYALVLEGPSCGATGTQVYPLNNGVNGEAIRIGWTPPPTYVGHATNPGQGCFDDREGDDSVDFVFWTKLYDALEGELCFDRNRVFASGNNSGASIANQLACKYAGDPQRPVRGVLANTGSLVTEGPLAPVCTTAPMAGMWVHEIGDTEAPFSGTKKAVDRALKVNKCSAASYDTATFEDYPIGGQNPNATCKKVLGCPADYPLVVCALPGDSHGSHDSIVNPGFATFVTDLLAP
jgi:hypothetical protein